MTVFNAAVYSVKAQGDIFIGTPEECLSYIYAHMDEQNAGEIYMTTKNCASFEIEE